MGEASPDAPPAHRWVGAFSSVFLARILSSGATFLTVILVARALGRGAYGELVVLLSVMKVAAELLGPALDTALVRFGARHLDSKSDVGLDYIRAIFKLKIGLAAVLLVCGIVLAWPLSRFLSNPASGLDVPPLLVALSFAGAISTVLWAFAQASLQAQQKFGRYAGIELFCSVVRLGIVAVILGAGVYRVTPILLAYVAAPALAAVVAFRGLPPGLFSRLDAGDVIRRNPPFREVGICGVRGDQYWRSGPMSFCSRTGTFPSEDIGDYGAALQLTLIGDLVILTLFNVLLPKASSLRSASELRAFLRQFRMPSLLMFAALVPFLIASRWIAIVAFGQEYIRAGGLFAILVLGAAFALGCSPAGAVLFSMGRTRTIAVMEALKLFGILTGGLVLVPEYGLFAMAWTVAAVKGVMGMITYVVALRASQLPRIGTSQ